jgi:hypothetical protein
MSRAWASNSVLSHQAWTASTCAFDSPSAYVTGAYWMNLVGRPAENRNAKDNKVAQRAVEPHLAADGAHQEVLATRRRCAVQRLPVCLTNCKQGNQMGRSRNTPQR